MFVHNNYVFAITLEQVIKLSVLEKMIDDDVHFNGNQLQRELHKAIQRLPEKQRIVFRGREISYRRYTYVMLNKPEGYVSATEDTLSPTVLTLLPEELQRIGLFPCGRLDKHTLGLVMLTDDGDLAHRLLSPKHHVKKKYRFECKFPLTDEEISYLEKGATLEDGYITKPSEIELDADKKSGYITLVEGKYHQIKRMIASFDNKVTFLKRISFATIPLDGSLASGEWRYLSDEEIALLESFG